MSRYLCTLLTCLALISHSEWSLAWSAPVHNAIGALAIGRLQDDTRDHLKDLIGRLDEDTVNQACNWPDVIREQTEWEWSKPLHYINIPRGDFSYRASRDCPDGRCAPEAIKHYARVLTRPRNTPQQNWQAFAWLCHLVADLHQPMHAGFADDRGGNDFDITLSGEALNLHYFWDHVAVMADTEDWQDLYRLVQDSPAPPLKPGWSRQDVDQWTNESHELAVHKGYPPSADIDEAWQRESQKLAIERINLAAARLASLIETLLTAE